MYKFGRELAMICGEKQFVYFPKQKIISFCIFFAVSIDNSFKKFYIGSKQMNEPE